MKIFKTATIIIIGILIVLAISATAFFLPSQQILNSIPIFRDLYNNTTLTVNSNNGKAEVFIGDKKYGETPVSISDLQPGQYTVTIKRISDKADLYSERNIEVDLQKNTEAIINIEVGPDNTNYGYVLYYTQSPEKNSQKGYLTVNSSLADTTAFVDGAYLNALPINAQFLKPKSYTLKVTKDGYQDLEVPIVVRGGYNLNVNAYLFPIPIKISNGE
ncbi:MAG TPA: PEGA domain-containing protein [Candidatus Dojkabacteria bacterium]|nr:PEGA domain-containing protein [Candidatus Dojkabacteria bacterium]